VYSKYMDTDANIKMLEDKLAVLIQAGVDGKADPLDDLRISNIRVLIKILNITRGAPSQGNSHTIRLMLYAEVRMITGRVTPGFFFSPNQ